MSVTANKEFVLQKAGDWHALIPQRIGKRPFNEWLNDNWAVWLRFCGIADEVWRRGRKHYSARVILEVMRHETVVREVDSQWKLNNTCAPALARLYTYLMPERAGFFSLREKDERD